jgi:ATP-binding cassette subfamily F protein 3
MQTAPPPPAPAPKPARPGRRAESPEERESARRRRRIKTLEDKIAALEAEVEALETRLWDEALTLGPVAAHELSKQKSAKRAELDALVEEWARISEEAESSASRPS